MEKKQDELFYGLLTVKLQNPPSDPAAVYGEIKKALGIESPLIDDRLGVLPPHMSPKLGQQKPAGEEYFVVGVEGDTLWKFVKQGHPNVVGCLHAMAYRGNNPPLELKMPPVPPGTHGGPRRKPGGPGL